MFKILIVEDDSEKLKNILLVLNRISAISSEMIDHELDVQSAKKRIIETAYDLLILDIFLPLARDKDVDPLGGIKLLEEITSRDRYKLPTHIFGLTEKEESIQASHQLLQKSIITLIRYSLSDIEWQDNLITGIQQRIASKNALVATLPEYQWDVAIVCALQSELEANLTNGLSWEILDLPNDDTIYHTAILETSNGVNVQIVAASAIRMGMPAAGALSMKMINLFRPRYIIMTGIMAGVTGRVDLGDIVIFDPSWDWGSGKWVSKEEREKVDMKSQQDSLFLVDPYQFNLDSKVRKIGNLISSDSNFLFQLRKGYGNGSRKKDITVHIGAVASGASVLSDLSMFDKIKEQHRKLLGVEMEAYALFSAAECSPRPKPVPICVKAVVDFGDSEKDDDYQDYGIHISSRFALEVISRLFVNNNL